MSRYSVVLATASGAREAQKISRALVGGKLAACVSIVPKIQSRYRWQGKVEETDESLLIIKTRRALVPRLIRKVRSIHSYDVPEIVALPIAAGDPAYLRWLSSSV